MPAPRSPAFDTLGLHAGQHPDPVTGARAVPIYQTTSYRLSGRRACGCLFNLGRAGRIYTRFSNPTTAVSGRARRGTGRRCGRHLHGQRTWPRAGRHLAEALPNAHVVALEGAGHMLISERPDEVLDAVRGLAQNLAVDCS